MYRFVGPSFYEDNRHFDDLHQRCFRYDVNWRAHSTSFWPCCDVRVMSILNRPEISSSYFFPVAARCEGAIEVNVGDAILRCYYHHPNPNRPTLIHFHGNGEAVAPYMRAEFPQWVQRSTRGMNTLLVEYRGYGGSTGAAQLVSMLPDGENMLQALNIDPARAIAFGRSIGSLYAIELACRCPTLAGLVIDSGIADIRQPFLDSAAVQRKLETFDRNEIESEVSQWFNHEKKISQYSGRLLLLHTKFDSLINIDHAYRLHRWATSATKELRVYTNGDHNTIFDINHHDINVSLRRMAVALFKECRNDEMSSIHYEPFDPERGVEVGCPIENARRREESRKEQERKLEARKNDPLVKEINARIEAMRRVDQPDVPAPTASRNLFRSIFGRIGSRFRQAK